VTADREPRKNRNASEAPLAEWIVGGIGLFLTGAAIAMLATEALRRDNTPPAVSVSVLEVSPQPEGWLVEILVSNDGGKTAAALGVEGSLANNDGVVETSAATIDYLPPYSRRRAGLFFTHDPAGLELELELRPMGYEEP
jgi:uncharacterized protein (TIGR02588 family)